MRRALSARNDVPPVLCRGGGMMRPKPDDTNTQLPEVEMRLEPDTFVGEPGTQLPEARCGLNAQ